ncbi:MAG TPA: PQQ-binding-like beta-propeller repeat protein, partial [Pirellulales bacterium]
MPGFPSLASRCVVVVTALAAFAGASLARLESARAAETWPQFRGPHGDGRADDATGLPAEFGETKNVVWKTAIDGRGHSSPVVADGLIWITTALETPLDEAEKKKRLAGLPLSDQLELAGDLTLEVLAVSEKSGEIVRRVKLFHVASPEPIHSLNSYASPTCVLDDGKVYCCFGTFGVAALNASTGEVLWKNDSLHCDHQNGPGSSPVLWKDRLIVHFDGRDEQFIAAYNTADGSVAWKTNRSGKMEANIDFKKAYGTPSLVEENGRTIVVSPAADWVYAYDPQDGRELWKVPYGKLGFSTTPKPVGFRDLTFVCTSYMKSKLLAIRTDGPNVGEVVWSSERQIPQKPSLLVVGDELYMVADSGVAACVDALTG